MHGNAVKARADRAQHIALRGTSASIKQSWAPDGLVGSSEL